MTDNGSALSFSLSLFLREKEYDQLMFTSEH